VPIFSAKSQRSRSPEVKNLLKMMPTTCSADLCNVDFRTARNGLPTDVQSEQVLSE